MRSAILAFFVGCLSVLLLPRLPSLPLLFTVFSVSVGLFFWPRGRLLVYLGLGFCWLAAQAHWILSQQLPAWLEGQDVELHGTVVGLPQQTPYGWQFLVETHALAWQQQPLPPPGRVRLTWYDPHIPSLTPGQTWQLTVRLKRARGFLNPAGFDYSSWLLQHRIRATGYVRAHSAQRIGSALVPIDQVRDHLSTALQNALASNPSYSLFIALVIGERHFITDEQWQTLRHTGTAHLMAISGLHISLVAGFFFLLTRWLWASIPPLVRRMPAQRVAAVAALATALGYALLAGWSIPTQRAFIMVSLIALGYLFTRRVSVSYLLALALFGVLLWDPLAPLSGGFWLSFGAVAILFYLSIGRHAMPRPQWWQRLQRYLWQFSHAQLALMLGLAPLTLFMFGMVSLSSFVANAVAIPAMLLYVPLAFSSALLLLLWPTVGIPLAQFAVWLLAQLWTFLAALNELPISIWQATPPPLWALGFMVPGVLLLLLPKGIPGRWLGLVWLMPAFFSQRPQPAPGDFWLTLLDVGQGTAVVVQTAHKVLVYDTGPIFRTGFNTGDSVVIPFLQQQGYQQVNRLVISHDDTDHSGGAAAIIADLSVDSVFTSAKRSFGPVPHQACQAGDTWTWDGVQFSFLHPPSVWYGDDNTHSCVLKIETKHGSALLTGDLLADTEAYLLRQPALKPLLAADILVVPHHGSASSSTAAFVQAVQPTIVLFSTGYLNQFRFPKPAVVARYQQFTDQLYNTATDGAITIRVQAERWRIKTAREQQRRFWHD